jgi:methyl-accepting chemotaxis protein
VTEVSDIATTLDRVTENLETRLRQFALEQTRPAAAETASTAGEGAPDPDRTNGRSAQSPGGPGTPEVAGDGAMTG